MIANNIINLVKIKVYTRTVSSDSLPTQLETAENAIETCAIKGQYFSNTLYLWFCLQENVGKIWAIRDNAKCVNVTERSVTMVYATGRSEGVGCSSNFSLGEIFRCVASL